MDLLGSLVDTNIRIYPSKTLLNYFKLLPIDDDVPTKIAKFVKGKCYEHKRKVDTEATKTVPIYLDKKDVENLNKLRAAIQVEEIEDSQNIFEEKTTNEDIHSEKSENAAKDVTTEKQKGKKIESKEDTSKDIDDECNSKSKNLVEGCNGKTKQSKEDCNEKTKNKSNTDRDELYLETSDIDWLYNHLQKLRNKNKGDKNIPYLHELLEGAQIETPDNKVIKRNPVLEARCVKLRAQQEARAYRKMTKSVDNVRMRFPEDSISYQLKQVNRQLIAIGQFIISIFAGFLFGFKGVEWMIGHLDFGFRLLLGVMCALIIALAEIYFLAKKLNEELNIPETVQLGGPTKFAHQQTPHAPKDSSKAIDKDHQD